MSLSFAPASLSAVYDIGFGLFHLTFWRWLKWPHSLEKSGRLNQSITQTLNVMLSYVLFAYGMSMALASPPFRAPLALAGSGFWLLRALAQPVLFARTRLSWVMTVVFAAGAVLHVAASISAATSIGFDKAAVGKYSPTLFLVGTVNGVAGLFRFSDAGATWVQINDAHHQWSGVSHVVGDPRSFGTVYPGTNSARGIIYGTSAN